MSYSDIIGATCAIISVFVAIVIGIAQYCQGKRLEAFETRQDERDELRLREKVQLAANSFIARHYEERGLIPLCAIAAMYNPSFPYGRKMYAEFCLMTEDEQNAVLSKIGSDLRVVPDPDFYGCCISSIEHITMEWRSGLRDLLYDNAKYHRRTIERYSRVLLEDIGGSCDHFDDRITTALAADAKGECDTSAIAVLRKEYYFESATEPTACRFVTTVLRWCASFTDNDAIDQDKYGSPGAYCGETIDTMEDLFLGSLFEIYTHLVLGGSLENDKREPNRRQVDGEL